MKGGNSMNEFVAAVSSIGFPIVACFGLAWYINKQIENFRKTIENNTNVITALLSYLKRGDDK